MAFAAPGLGSLFKISRSIRTKAFLAKERPLKRLTLGKMKTGGRNNFGNITAYHRGGGAKQLLRKIDLKRSVVSTGIVERIEYDPNRSARLALVRWIEGVKPSHRKKNKTLEETAQPLCNGLHSEVSSDISRTWGGLFSSYIGMPHLAWKSNCTIGASKRSGSASNIVRVDGSSKIPAGRQQK